MLIRLENGIFARAEDRFQPVGPDGAAPADGRPLLIGLALFLREGAALLDEGRVLGVALEPSERVEDLAYDLPRLALVALNFPKFRDGRPYSSAMLLRRRYGFPGEIRAVGDVLREQAFELVRCGFDGFCPSDGSEPVDFAAAAGRYSHVYQAGADARPPAFVERSGPHGL